MLHATIAVPQQAQALTDLINSAYRGDSSRQGWTTEADILEGTRISEQGVLDIIAHPTGDLHVFSDDNGYITGCVYLEPKEDHLYLGMLVVRPGMQGSGIGKQVLAYADTFAQKLALRSIQMTVIHTRTELIAWYNRHGYVPTGEREAWDDSKHIGKRKVAQLYFLTLEKKLPPTA